MLGKNANGGLFATMSPDETTKNHPGGVSDVESCAKNGCVYKTNSPIDGYSALELFLSKLNPEREALFQYPKRNWRPSDKIGYENRPLGINKLSTMMKDISSAAGLSRIYTNHSIRATAMTLWSTAGLTNREIMAISGHRNKSSLKRYHCRPSVNQRRKCSDVLACALGDSETIRGAEQRQIKKLVNRSPAARDLRAFLVFSQHPVWVYYTSKSIENAIYCLIATRWPGIRP